jgi:leucyl aminopeptidase
VFKSIRAGSPRSGPVVVGVLAGEKLPRGHAARDRAASGALSAALATPGFLADPGETISANDDHLLVGLGARDGLSDRRLRSIGGRLVRALRRAEVRSARLAIAGAIPARSIAPGRIGQCLGEGMGLANWRVADFDGAATQAEPATGGLTIGAEDRDVRKGLARGLDLAASTNVARRLGATPPNIANPRWLAGECRRMAKATGLRCRVISYADAQKMGMGGLVNVGRASSVKPCMIVLEHRPAKVAAAARGERIVLVGKTITYDTGGYSMKTRDGMKGMKYDKNGGMAVIGAMHAIATLKVPVHVTALLPAAENMVGGDAYRPDDIITMHNGITVEVTNTDAEGRLVLADALSYACAKLKPTAIIDTATLTGGVVVALGSWCAGLFANDDAMASRVEAAAEATDERVWRLPLWKEHCDFMRAKHADLWNSGPRRDGHPIQGAAFLSHFVDAEVPWAHVDIAGVSTVDSDNELYVTGPTGFGVRLLTEAVEAYSR